MLVSLSSPRLSSLPTHGDRLDAVLSHFVARAGVTEALLADESGLCVAASGAVPDQELLAALTAHASLMLDRVRDSERFPAPLSLGVTLAGGSVLHVHPFRCEGEKFALATTGPRPALDDLHGVLEALREQLR